MKKFLALFAVLLGFILPSQIVNAADKSNSQKVGFDIQAFIPDNQIDKENSYFDLRMKPKQEQTLQVIVNNTSDEAGTYKIRVNQAYTNDQGFIDYQKQVKPDKSMPYDINDLVDYPKKIKVPANSSRIFKLHLTMPEKEYSGQILAGIQVNKVMKKTSGISNSFGYIISLKLTENDNEVKRDLKLLSVKPAATFGKTSIVATLQNPKMDAYGHLKYQSKVLKRDTSKVVFKKTYDSNMQMAPNSQYKFAIEYGKRLKSGDYTLDLLVSDAKNNRWHFKKNFTITAEQADQVNSVTVDQGQKKSYWWLYLLAGLLAAAIVLLLILIFKRRKKDDEDSETTDAKHIKK
ncbi:DUF916 and DUF3324 domain-containing protein [Lapidilactobacillus dextrinicus]|uniref:DUF916 and DUF3324 domain-containing protein n=1 Tax=Lapidilactobacillus dextrinicus TaxID=51664 RepID=UPI00070D2544|nr:DUF916 and DUF3324 domain-containing protein [Lapidilactobacillus dextrinicus]QFG46377.1 DUF916 and DUF3324 domain-containing protein [Lapidilactobacillus dextrinicus]